MPRTRAARLLVYVGTLVLLLAAGMAATLLVTPALAGSEPDGGDGGPALTITIPSITTVTIPIPQPPMESTGTAEQVTSTGVSTVTVQATTVATTVTATATATTTVAAGPQPAVPDRPGQVGLSSPPPPPAPGRVTRLSARPGDHRVTLTWVLPTSPSFAYVVLSRSRARASASRAPARELVVYRGRRRRFVDRHLKNDVVYRYVVVAVSTSGARSAGVAVLARPSLRALAAPVMNARVSSPPLLRWVPTRRATYYNVQLFLGKEKLLSLWPSKARLQLRDSWSYAGKTYRLSKGRYTWYVWPGFGDRSKPKYGPLLGQSAFVVTP
jgi:hypothetical protein